MSWIQLVLPIDVLESLVIIMEDKQIRFEVITQMCQSPDYDIKLLVISAIIALGSIEFLTEISNSPSGLD